MKNIDDIESDPRFVPFCELACALQKDYGVKVWHSNITNTPAGKSPEDMDMVRDFYEPLERYGYNLDYEVYCYGSPKDE